VEVRIVESRAILHLIVGKIDLISYCEIQNLAVQNNLRAILDPLLHRIREHQVIGTLVRPINKI
jgi:hypothetical protein